MVYVSFVVSMLSRAIVGRGALLGKRTMLVLDAPDMALWRRRRAGHQVGPGLVQSLSVESTRLEGSMLGSLA
ncbi:hypothetical protein DQ384_31615 [Sphaerisporangium album]|uniref:Uncharacterized protein n=1 Tax=Sphaerisporangium album TaxID=509200 RepID=A0A367F4Z1_9ACTN|nr:hypothetical protein DQ384_31615 [Sphaerisporangium album]